MSVTLLCRISTLLLAQTSGPAEDKTMPTTSAPAASRVSATPRELGDIQWRRKFDDAVAESKRSRKPLLVLFQEVPGCSTCVNYGDLVLRHPLIVEAAETLFVPVAIYNNIPGDDERVLKAFKETAWNNPVVRIVSADQADLCPRVADDYSIGGMTTAMLGLLLDESAILIIGNALETSLPVPCLRGSAA